MWLCDLRGLLVGTRPVADDGRHVEGGRSPGQRLAHPDGARHPIDALRASARRRGVTGTEPGKVRADGYGGCCRAGRRSVLS